MLKRMIMIVLMLLYAGTAFACHVNPYAVCEDDYDNFRSWKICNGESRNYDNVQYYINAIQPPSDVPLI
jgi:hypothetical protein